MLNNRTMAIVGAGVIQGIRHSLVIAAGAVRQRDFSLATLRFFVGFGVFAFATRFTGFAFF